MIRTLLATIGFLGVSTHAWAQEDAMKEAFMPKSMMEILSAGGFFMIPLVILSIILVALIFVFLFTLRRRAVVTGRYMATADALLRKGDYLGLLAASNRQSESVAQIMRRTLDFLTKNPHADFAEVREIAETEGARQAASLQQQTTYLADIGTLSPMVGLLGTVAGMIKSFIAMAGESGVMGGGDKPFLLAQGIAEALIATAAGLIVAIPAMAAYAYFRGRAHRLISELEGASTQLLSILSTQLRRRKSTRSPQE